MRYNEREDFPFERGLDPTIEGVHWDVLQSSRELMWQFAFDIPSPSLKIMQHKTKDISPYYQPLTNDILMVHIRVNAYVAS